MVHLTVLLMLGADDPAATLGKAMRPVYDRDAAEYALAVESAPKTPLELKKEPVFEWSNPARNGLQQGVIYLWTRDGRPAAFGCIFSQPHASPPGRKVIHELHALDAEKLVVAPRPNALNEWTPQAGLARTPLADAPAPAASPGARLLQMRRLAQEFGGHAVEKGGDKWALRLLTAPLARYPEAKTGILDGAVFALVTTAGTDPEVILVVEARQEGGKAKWEYALGRFSDRDLIVTRKEAEVWTSVRSETNAHNHDPLHLYRVYGDKVVSLDGTLLARVRVTPRAIFGEVVPVTDK